MDEAFIGAIFAWPISWCPLSYSYCNGTQLSVAQNQALYSLLGTAFGGSIGKTFNLPNLQGRTIVGATNMGGTYPSGVNIPSAYVFASGGGSDIVTLSAAQAPLMSHSHTAIIAGTATATLTGLTATGALKATAQAGTTNTPGSSVSPARVPDTGSGDSIQAYGAPDNSTTMPVTVTVTPPSGGLPVDLSKTTVTVGVTPVPSIVTQPHNNMQPFLALNYIIALEGLYPQRQ
ncbi:phage tail protein [Paludibacter jiangxiensis]|uniref:Microcystin-dependent protein n=1 Tax=Paludibacter jiangxiensis TaxID=681398 RepID=A0A170ZDT1_9BACT|nr:tail fiber protein [Paludibacter jiangxiensis]GAT62566.1 microcystin-dependent protein [Paludibacter jiangxiensis]